MDLSLITDQNYKDTHITFVCDSSEVAEKMDLMPKSDSSCWHFSSRYEYLEVQLFFSKNLSSALGKCLLVWNILILQT